MLPEGWELKHANDLCSQISVGIVVKPSTYYVDEKSGIRAFRSANVGEGFVKDRDWIYISPEGHHINRKSVLRTNDVLIVRTGYPGTACLVLPEYNGSNCIDVIFARPLTDRVIPSYLCLFTNSEYGKKQVLDGQGGLAQQHFNVGAFKQLKLPLPPLPEQKRIAEILSTWDASIGVQERLITNARTQKKALIQTLLTGKKRLPGFEGEWRELIFGTIATSEKRRVDPSTIRNPTKCLELEHLEPNTGRMLGFCDARAQSSLKTVFEPKHILYGKLRPYLRKFHRPDFAGVCSTEIWSIKAVEEFCSSDFLYFLVQSAKFEEAVDVSSGSKMPRADWGLVKKAHFKIPCLQEQQVICQLLDASEAELQRFNVQLETLLQEKSALMQQLLTGKRRVKIEEQKA
jgi:type I restriction enzyme, S subunit